QRNSSLEPSFQSRPPRGQIYEGSHQTSEDLRMGFHLCSNARGRATGQLASEQARTNRGLSYRKGKRVLGDDSRSRHSRANVLEGPASGRSPQSLGRKGSNYGRSQWAPVLTLKHGQKRSSGTVSHTCASWGF